MYKVIRNCFFVMDIHVKTIHIKNALIKSCSFKPVYKIVSINIAKTFICYLLQISTFTLSKIICINSSEDRDVYTPNQNIKFHLNPLSWFSSTHAQRLSDAGILSYSRYYYIFQPISFVNVIGRNRSFLMNT